MTSTILRHPVPSSFVRRLAPALIVGILVVLGLVMTSPTNAAGAVRTSTAADAPAPAIPVGNYVWLTTDAGTTIFQRSPAGLVPLPLPGGGTGPTIANHPQGGAVYSRALNTVFIPEADGIHLYNPFSAISGPVLTSEGYSGGYTRLALSADATELAAVRTGGEVIDFLRISDSALLGTSNFLAPVTGMSTTPSSPFAVTVSYNSQVGNQTLSVSGSAGPGDIYLQSSTLQTMDTAWSLDGSYLYAASASATPTESGITRYDRRTRTTEFLPTPQGFTPQRLLISPAGDRLYVAASGDNGGQGGVYIIDTSSMTFENLGSALPQTTSLAYGAMDVAIGPDGDRSLYVPTDTALVAVEFGELGPQPSFVDIENATLYGAAVIDLPAEWDLAGNDQSTFTSTPFAQPLSVGARDIDGTGMRGIPVLAEIMSGAATFSGGGRTFTGVTDSNGQFVLPTLEVGAVAGLIQIEITGPGSNVVGLFRLTVVTPTAPGAPTIDSLTNGDGAVSVAFTPGAAGSLPTTGYVVTAENKTAADQSDITSVGTGSPILVSGLANGQTYTFTVTAKDPAGDVQSAPSNAIIVGIPAAVTNQPGPATAGEAYSFTFTTVGAPTPTMSLDVGTPPPDGLTWEADTMTLHGTPTAASVGTTFLAFSVSNALASDVEVPVDFVVNAVTAAPDHMVVTGDGQAASVNTTFRNPVAVTVETADGQPVAGATVQLDVVLDLSTGDATFSPGGSMVAIGKTDADGTFQANVRAGATAGAVTIWAHVRGLEMQTVTLHVTPDTTATRAPGAAQKTSGHHLAATGGTMPVGVIVLGILLLLGGGVLVVSRAVRRRSSATVAEPHDRTEDRTEG